MIISKQLKLQIKKEYKLLKEKEKNKRYAISHFLTSSLPKNINKNRYPSYPAYESTRVKIYCDHCNTLDTRKCDHDHDDYIHGNFVTSPLRERTFIACQAPLPNTMIHFWKMIWQNNISLVLMLTLFEEAGAVKCHQYFPTSSEPFKMGDFVIQLICQTNQNNVIIRELILKNIRCPNEEKKVFHAQYLGWPDHSVPESVNDVFPLIHLSDNVNRLFSCTSPMVVHCSAGIGRTGTFISILNCIISISMYGTCDVAKIVEKLREERYGCITSKEQYKFIYKVIHAYISQ